MHSCTCIFFKYFSRSVSCCFMFFFWRVWAYFTHGPCGDINKKGKSFAAIRQSILECVCFFHFYFIRHIPIRFNYFFSLDFLLNVSTHFFEKKKFSIIALFQFLILIFATIDKRIDVIYCIHRFVCAACIETWTIHTHESDLKDEMNILYRIRCGAMPRTYRFYHRHHHHHHHYY